MSNRSVIIHVSDGEDALARAHGTAEGLLADYPDAEIRIVVAGPALDELVGGQAEGRSRENVTVAACAVGLGRRGISVDSPQTGVEVVPGAASVLADAQRAGAAYIRV